MDTWLFTLKDLVIVLPLFYLTIPYLVKEGIIGGKYYIIPLWSVFAYAWWATINYFTCQLSTVLYPDQTGRWQSYLSFVTENGIGGMFQLDRLDVFLFDFIFMVYLPVGPKFIKTLMESEYKNAMLENEKLSLEIKFLKSQITPHFLFNTLNNIYIMAKRFNRETPEMILKLSSLMRYILYESDSDRIALFKELSFLSDFIDLNRLKYGEAIDVVFEAQKITKPYRIAPLVLLPFVENAFKHGPETDPKNNWLEIKVWMEHNELNMEVANKVQTAEKEISKHLVFGGVGLKNAHKRLQFYYDGKHELTSQTVNGLHQVKLKILLK